MMAKPRDHPRIDLSLSLPIDTIKKSDPETPFPVSITATLRACTPISFTTHITIFSPDSNLPGVFEVLNSTTDQRIWSHIASATCFGSAAPGTCPQDDPVTLVPDEPYTFTIDIQPWRRFQTTIKASFKKTTQEFCVPCGLDTHVRSGEKYKIKLQPNHAILNWGWGKGSMASECGLFAWTCAKKKPVKIVPVLVNDAEFWVYE